MNSFVPLSHNSDYIHRFNYVASGKTIHPLTPLTLSCPASIDGRAIAFVLFPYGNCAVIVRRGLKSDLTKQIYTTKRSMVWTVNELNSICADGQVVFKMLADI